MTEVVERKEMKERLGGENNESRVGGHPIVEQLIALVEREFAGGYAGEVVIESTIAATCEPDINDYSTLDACIYPSNKRYTNKTRLLCHVPTKHTIPAFITSIKRHKQPVSMANLSPPHM
jgi:hypothetical protein